MKVCLGEKLIPNLSGLENRSMAMYVEVSPPPIKIIVYGRV